jgi:hypothetical protein
MSQQIAVYVIVFAAAVFAAWRLPGSATRLRYAKLFQRLGLRRFGRYLEARVMRSMVAGGCQACSGGTQRTVHAATRPPANRGRR